MDQSGQIATDIQTIWQRAKILHEVTKDDTSWSKHLWKTLPSWLPNPNWLKQLFVRTLRIEILILGTCMMSQCFIWYCKQNATTYHEWKQNKMRYRIKTGKYFETSSTLQLQKNLQRIKERGDLMPRQQDKSLSYAKSCSCAEGSSSFGTGYVNEALLRNQQI